jgi:osmoprotectant transport system substrate-binding protein
MSDDLKRVLDKVSARLTTDDLTDLNSSVSGNSGIDPEEAARKWIQANGFDAPIGK